MISESRSNNFTVTFNKLEGAVYSATDIPLPGMTLGEAIVPYSTLDLYVPGDKITFDPITITFNVDENLTNYLEIYNWMMDLGHPERSKVSRPDDKDAVSQATITVLNNQKNPIYNVNLIDCFPTNLGEVILSTQSSEPSICTVTIRFSYFEIAALQS